MLVGIVGLLVLLPLGNTRDIWLPNRSLRDTGKGIFKSQITHLSELVIHGNCRNIPIQVGYPWTLQITLLFELFIQGKYR